MAASLVDNGLTFELEDEDHTLANALRFMLNKNPHVTFCGYSIPHPAQPIVNLRVQTSGEISATEALRQACANLKAVCGALESEFTTAFDKFESEQGGAAQRTNGRGEAMEED